MKKNLQRQVRGVAVSTCEQVAHDLNFAHTQTHVLRSCVRRAPPDNEGDGGDRK